MGLNISLAISSVTAGIWEEDNHNLAFKEVDLGGAERDSSCSVVSWTEMLLLEGNVNFVLHSVVLPLFRLRTIFGLGRKAFASLPL